jgi:hypothetical protein
MLTFAAFALGLLNLVPLVGLVRPLEFVRLYGVRAETAELRVLLRHRAVLLGCVGAALIIGSGLYTFARERIRARQFQRPSAMQDDGGPL